VIVADANLIAYLWVPCPDTALAEQVLRQDGEWAAPLLWRSEFRNILLGYVRRRMLTLGVAQRIAVEAEAHVGAHEFAVRSDVVLRQAASSGCTAYDCEYVVLALQLGIPLVTADKQILRAFPAAAQSPSQFAGT
jgi:predicted nucleic acid-binding protein